MIHKFRVRTVLLNLTTHTGYGIRVVNLWMVFFPMSLGVSLMQIHLHVDTAPPVHSEIVFDSRADSYGLPSRWV